jgi:hypothetical protein
MPVLKAGAIAGVASAVINALIFFAAGALGFITDDIQMQPDTPMTLIPVIASSIMPSLFATVVYWLFLKHTKNGYKNFSVMAIVLLVLSFSNPFMMIPGVTIAYGVSLNLMHIVVVALLLNRFKAVS